MKKELKVGPNLVPMPVLIISTYNDDNTVNCMNMAWGGIYDTEEVILNLDTEHRTTKNILNRGAFTLSIANTSTLVEADYFGIVSGFDDANKFLNSKMTSTRSPKVDAPIVNEFPLTLECELLKDETKENNGTIHLIGKIVGIFVDESVLNEKGKVDVNKLNPLIYNTFDHSYYEVGKKVGAAWHDGLKLKK